jgi:hypothetical protein
MNCIDIERGPSVGFLIKDLRVLTRPYCPPQSKPQTTLSEGASLVDSIQKTQKKCFGPDVFENSSLSQKTTTECACSTELCNPAGRAQAHHLVTLISGALAFTLLLRKCVA